MHTHTCAHTHARTYHTCTCALCVPLYTQGLPLGKIKGLGGKLGTALQDLCGTEVRDHGTWSF